ncbi:hypothetical protein CF326_g8069 [Tilletia indica]|nr:hypothetical protein CF326_g8069 [Tilletia indica]
MFGEDRSQSPRMASPWTSRLSTSLDNAASRGPSPLSIGHSASGTPDSQRARRGTSAAQHQASQQTPGPQAHSSTSGLGIRSSRNNSGVDISNEDTVIPNSDTPPVTSSSHSPSLAPLNPEHDTIGNIEYKLKLLPPTRDRFNRLVTQLKWRLLQGGGMAIYEVGVLDDGALVGLSRREMRASLDTLEAMASHLGARVEVRRVVVVQRYPGQDPTASSSTSPAMLAASGPTPPPASRASSSLPDIPHLSLQTASTTVLNGVHAGVLPPASHLPLPNSAAPDVLSDRIPRASPPTNPTLRSDSPSHTPSSSLPSPPSTSLPPFRTMAQIHAANKVLNEAYLLRELGAKRRGSRAGPADIVHLGLLDAGQARKWIGGGKRTFSADMRLDLPPPSSSSSQQQGSSSSPSVLAVGSVPAALDELGTSDSRGKLVAEMALPLVVLPPNVLLREIEHDQLVEQWEEDLKRRRAELAAVNHAAAVGGSSNGSGSNSNSNTQRQRRRRGSNRMEDGSPTLAGMSFFASSRKPWVPDPILAAGGVGVGSVDVDPDAETVRPIVTHSKEGSGPVRIAGAGGAVDGDEMEGHANSDHRLQHEEGRDPGARDSDEDEGSETGNSSDGSAGKDGGEEEGDRNTDRSDEDDDDEEEEGFFSFSLSLSDDEDGQIKGGRRKKDAKSKKGTRRPLSTAGGSKAGAFLAGEGTRRPISEKSKRNGASEPEEDGIAQGEGTRQPLSMHDKLNGDALATSPDTRRSPPVQLAVLARKKSSGSERKAEHRAAVLEDTLVRADAEARGVRAGLSPQQRSTSPSTLIDVPHGRVMDGGSRPDAITDEVAGKVGSDGAMSRAASSTSTPLRDTSTGMATAVRFIVEAKVLRKLRKGDFFIDYAGI